MRCKNCGVHFQDDEKRCPMCDTPAGRGSRASVPRYTDYTHTEHSDKTCTHKTTTDQWEKQEHNSNQWSEKKWAAQQQNTQQRTAQAASNANKARWIKRIVAFVVIINIVPTILSAVAEVLRSQAERVVEDGVLGTTDTTLDLTDYGYSFGFENEGGVQAVEDVEDPYAYLAYEEAELQTIIGSHCSGETNDGELFGLSVQPGMPGYTLELTGDGFSYMETGTASCVKVWLGEEESFDSYLIELRVEQQYAEGDESVLTDRFAPRADATTWFCLADYQGEYHTQAIMDYIYDFEDRSLLLDESSVVIIDVPQASAA